MWRAVLMAAVWTVAAVTWGTPAGAQNKPAADPVIVFETVKGTVEIQLFQAEAPKSVAHILTLMKRGFYRGQRFHRVISTLAQVGDPQSRNFTLKDYWGSGNSGSPIGVFELSKKRSHVRGAVGLAHSGNPLGADSQIYIMKAASPSLDGKHAIIGRVVSGMAAVDKLAVGDLIKDIKVR